MHVPTLLYFCWGKEGGLLFDDAFANVPTGKELSGK